MFPIVQMLSFLKILLAESNNSRAKIAEIIHFFYQSIFRQEHCHLKDKNNYLNL